MQPAKVEQRNQFIDILRGMAVIGVVAHHLWFPQFASNIVQFEFLGTTVYPLIINNGWLGVNLFFVLSGFVLFRVEFAQSFEKVVEYLKLRAFRLLPLYFIFIVLVSVIHKGELPSLQYLFLHLTGLNSFFAERWMPIPMLVFWSIGIEIVFSLSLPLLIIAATKIGFWRLVWLVLAACFLYRIYADFAWYEANPAFPNAFINPLKDNYFGRLDDFILGMAAAQFLREKRSINVKWALAGSFALLVFSLYGWNYVWANPRTVTLTILVSLFHTAFAVAMFGLIISLKNMNAWRLKVFWPIALSGQICYSVYIIHFVLLRFAPFEHDTAGIIKYLIATWLVSIVTFIYIESSGIRKLPAWVTKFRP